MSANTSLVRFALLQSVRRSHLVPLTLVIVFGGVVSGQWLLLALFSLLYALPHAATRLIEADRDERLNDLRLAGTSPAHTCAALTLGWAAPWLVVGVIAAAAWAAANPVTGLDVVRAAAMMGASATLAVLATVLTRGETGPDARLLSMGLVLAALVGAVMQINAIQAGSYIGARTMAGALSTIGLETIVCAACWPGLLRVLQRPVASAERRRGARLVFRFGRFPVSAAAFSLSLYPAVVLTAIAGAMLAILRWQSPPAVHRDSTEWLWISLVSYAALPVGAFVISAGARSDRESGRFELLRLSPRRPARLLAELATGAAAPFVAATLLLQLTVLVLWRQSVGAQTIVAATAFTLAPVAALEGWRGAWPLSLLLPVALPLTAMVGAALPFLENPTWSTLPHAVFLGVAWMPWAAALRTLARPSEPPLSGGTGAVAALLVTAGVVWQASDAVRAAVDLTACLLLLAGFIVDARAPSRFDRIAPAAIGAMAMALFFLSPRYGLVEALVLAPVPAIAWWLACRIHVWAGGSDAWSTLARASLAFLLFSGIPFVSVFDALDLRVPFGGNTPAVAADVLVAHLLMTTVFIVIGLCTEAVYRVWRRARHSAAMNG